MNDFLRWIDRRPWLLLLSGAVLLWLTQIRAPVALHRSSGGTKDLVEALNQPFTHSTCLSVWSTRTRSRWYSMTWPMSL